MIELNVIGPRLLVQVEDQSQYTLPSGLITVQRHDPGVIGTVVRCGPDVVDVKDGDVVLFSPSAGVPMDYEQTRYLVLDEDELLAVWDSEQEPI